MKKHHLTNLLIILISLSPVAYLLLVWKSIPESYISRFELDNSFEKVQTRATLLTAALILSVVAALLYLLMRNLSKVDPKVDDTTPKSTFHKLGLIISIFLLIINYFFILSAQYGWIVNTRVALAFVGLLLASIGNYMNNLKPNYIAGIRLPWTLNDPENWRMTHQMAGKLWFAGGALMIVLGFVLPVVLLKPFMIGILILLVIIPGIYSYRIFRRKHMDNA